MNITWRRTVINGETKPEDFIAEDENARTIGRIYRHHMRMSVSIDDIVAKYRGLPQLPGYEVDPKLLAEKAASFRADLEQQSRAEQIGSYLGLHGPFERSFMLLWCTLGEPDGVFWRVFLDWWNACDGGLWNVRNDMTEVLRRRTASSSPRGFLNPDNRAFYEGLPATVTVFRGCARLRVRGLPWTIDREVAVFFAGGGRSRIAPRDPMIATAKIAKDDIFFVVSRESEIVLDPDKVQQLRVEPTVAA